MKKPANYRLIVEVDAPWVPPGCNEHEVWMSALSDCAMAIRRHVDGATNVTAEYDYICSHCGCEWEDPAECCDRSIEESDAAKAATQ